MPVRLFFAPCSLLLSRCAVLVLPPAEPAGECLCRDVRIDLALEPGHLVLEEELAALEALELELVVAGLLGEALDHVVKIAMLDLELQDPLLEHGALDFVHRGRRPLPCGPF